MYSILVAIDVFIAAGLIGLILIQQGKGANAGAAFGGGGGGASSTVFGARGSGSFMTRATAILATLFFINSIVLAYLASNRPEAESVVDTVAPVLEAPLNQEPVDVPAIDTNGGVDPLLDQLNQEIQQQDALPTDVPGTDPLSELEQQSQQAKEALDKALEETNTLPADIPQ